MTASTETTGHAGPHAGELVSPDERARLRRWRKWVKGLLLGLIALDIFYPVVIFGSGQWWFDLMHGADYVDPQGLLKRLGAVWATFALFLIIAYFRWEKGPHWLMLIAGMRFSEMIADWFYWSYAEDHTLIGTLGLLSASPTNFALGIFFFRAYFVFHRAYER